MANKSPPFTNFLVNLINGEQINPFYQLPLPDAQEYKKTFLSSEVGCDDLSCIGFNPEAS